MESSKPIICGPEDNYTVDLPFDSDIDQDEANRTRRKPGAPPYNPNAKWMDPPVVPATNGPTVTSDTPNKTDGPRISITVDAVPKDGERQEELDNTSRPKPSAAPPKT
jgi:hypothetical protein